MLDDFSDLRTIKAKKSSYNLHDVENKTYSKITISLTKKQKEELSNYGKAYGVGMSHIIKRELENSNIITPYDENKKEYNKLTIHLDDNELRSINEYCERNNVKSPEKMIKSLLKNNII